MAAEQSSSPDLCSTATESEQILSVLDSLQTSDMSSLDTNVDELPDLLEERSAVEADMLEFYQLLLALTDVQQRLLQRKVQTLQRQSHESVTTDLEPGEVRLGSKQKLPFSAPGAALPGKVAVSQGQCRNWVPPNLQLQVLAAGSFACEEFPVGMQRHVDNEPSAMLSCNELFQQPELLECSDSRSTSVESTQGTLLHQEITSDDSSAGPSTRTVSQNLLRDIKPPTCFPDLQQFAFKRRMEPRPCHGHSRLKAPPTDADCVTQK